MVCTTSLRQNIRIFVLIIVEPALWRGYIGYASKRTPLVDVKFKFDSEEYISV